MRAAVAIAALASLLAAWSPASAAQGSERERIVAERHAISALYSQQELACAQRFAVTACVEDVQARRREALAPLRERELNLDEADRRRRAAERRASVAAKQQAALLRPPPPAEVASRPRAAPAAATSTAVTKPLPAPVDSKAHAIEAAARVQAAHQRQVAARATQERVAQRLAERAKSGRRVVPLPLHAASSASAASSTPR